MNSNDFLREEIWSNKIPFLYLKFGIFSLSFWEDLPLQVTFFIQYFISKEG